MSQLFERVPLKVGTDMRLEGSFESEGEAIGEALSSRVRCMKLHNGQHPDERLCPCESAEEQRICWSVPCACSKSYGVHLMVLPKGLSEV